MTSDMENSFPRPKNPDVGHPIWCLSGARLWGLVEAEEVSFGVFEGGDEAPARSDFGFREGDGPPAATTFAIASSMESTWM